MAIDQKYGDVTVSDAPGTPFGDDEPVFIIRGQDALALEAIDHYTELAIGKSCPLAFISDVQNVRTRFAEWQEHNATKLPD